jgi:hypothetical protein
MHIPHRCEDEVAMLTRSMFRRLAACWIVAAIIFGAAGVSRPAEVPETGL